jgi:hypothetical protein
VDAIADNDMTPIETNPCIHYALDLGQRVRAKRTRSLVQMLFVNLAPVFASSA